MKKELVIKSNKIIQKASFDFTELELKNVNYVIAQIVKNPNINENEYLEIDIKEICKAIGISPKGQNYKDIRESFKNLTSKSKWIKLNEKGDLLNFAFVMKVVANDNTGKMYIKVMDEMISMVKNYMIEKNFTIFELTNTLKLKKKYTIRLYELCKSWQKNKIVYGGKEINGFVFEIEKSRENWTIPKAYNYTMYKTQIIEPAIEEINKKTDIEIKIIDEIKTGKKIKSYIIEIKEKQNQNKEQTKPKQNTNNNKVKPNGRKRNYTKEQLDNLFDDIDNIKL